MINEAYGVTKALLASGIDFNDEIRSSGLEEVPSNPCIRICLNDDGIASLRILIGDDLDGIYKYGSNQGSYPHMNLLPLFALPTAPKGNVDLQVKNELGLLKKAATAPETLSDDDIEAIVSVCTEPADDSHDSRWFPKTEKDAKKFASKYVQCMVKEPHELLNKAGNFEPVQLLIAATDRYRDPQVLYDALKEYAFQALRNRQGTDTALLLLFGITDKRNTPTLSFLFDSEELVKSGYSTCTYLFNSALNKTLRKHGSVINLGKDCSLDAFGQPYKSNKERMTTFKLPGKNNASLRTMNDAAACQTRYSLKKNDSFPLSTENRELLAGAMRWINNPAFENKVWIWTSGLASKSDSPEWLYVYPAECFNEQFSYTGLFTSSPEGKFESTASTYIQELRRGVVNRDAEDDDDGIHVFVLRKITKKSPGRTRVIYTRAVDVHSLEDCIHDWADGCSNHPEIFGGFAMRTPCPMEIAKVINVHINRDGKESSESKIVPNYYGVELLLDRMLPVERDMHIAVEKCTNLVVLVGAALSKGDFKNISKPCARTINLLVPFLSLLLYREGIYMDSYCNEAPYLLGQLLKESDILHELYCKVVRDKNYPPQFVGSALFRVASDSPNKAFVMLGQRIMPYLAWAKTFKNEVGKDEELEKSRRLAGWICKEYQITMDKLGSVWKSPRSFSDDEKAQLFIGFLSSLPKESSVSESNEQK
jgi:hypothetical protein